MWLWVMVTKFSIKIKNIQIPWALYSVLILLALAQKQTLGSLLCGMHGQHPCKLRLTQGWALSDHASFCVPVALATGTQEQVFHLSCSNRSNLSWDLVLGQREGRVGTGISKLVLKSLCLAGEPSSRERPSWLPRKEVNQYSDERVTQRKHVLGLLPSSLKPGCIFPSVAMAPCSLLIVSVLLHLDRCGSCNCKQSYEWMQSPPPRGGPDFSLPQMLVANP